MYNLCTPGDLGLGLGIDFENLGPGIVIWDGFLKCWIWDWDLAFIFPKSGIRDPRLPTPGVH